jgi:thiol-disulfide isomerase/thioredoxin
LHSYLGRIFKPIALLICILVVVIAIAFPANAILKDDHYDGSIFALYGGNGSIVPPKVSLAKSLSSGKPALLAFYVDDSYDCKLYTPVLNDMQAFYGKAVSIIPISVDSFDLTKQKYQPSDEPYYYRGFVPQTVLISAEGKVLFDQEGKPDFEDIEAALRKIPGLPSPDPKLLQRKAIARPINEVNP